MLIYESTSLNIAVKHPYFIFSPLAPNHAPFPRHGRWKWRWRWSCWRGWKLMERLCGPMHHALTWRSAGWAFIHAIPPPPAWTRPPRTSATVRGVLLEMESITAIRRESLSQYTPSVCLCSLYNLCGLFFFCSLTFSWLVNIILLNQYSQLCAKPDIKV